MVRPGRHEGVALQSDKTRKACEAIVSIASSAVGASRRDENAMCRVLALRSEQRVFLDDVKPYRIWFSLWTPELTPPSLQYRSTLTRRHRRIAFSLEMPVAGAVVGKATAHCDVLGCLDVSHIDYFARFLLPQAPHHSHSHHQTHLGRHRRLHGEVTV